MILDFVVADTVDRLIKAKSSHTIPISGGKYDVLVGMWGMCSCGEKPSITLHVVRDGAH